MILVSFFTKDQRFDSQSFSSVFPGLGDEKISVSEGHRTKWRVSLRRETLATKPENHLHCATVWHIKQP
jgi:hypothetical protein